MTQEKGTKYYLKNLAFNMKMGYEVHKQLIQIEEILVN